MTRLSHIPGLPPLIACLGLLAAWELAARVFDISGLPPARDALRELPVILTDPEALGRYLRPLPLRERATRRFNEEERVRGTPHPTEYAEIPAMPSPSRGEGAATATATRLT